MNLLNFVVGALITFLLNGVAIKLLWGWFLVPTLGLPIISLAQATGVGILVISLAWQYIPKTEEQQKESLIENLILYVLVLGVGWVVHLLM